MVGKYSNTFSAPCNTFFSKPWVSTFRKIFPLFSSNVLLRESKVTIFIFCFFVYLDLGASSKCEAFMSKIELLTEFSDTLISVSPQLSPTAIWYIFQFLSLDANLESFPNASSNGSKECNSPLKPDLRMNLANCPSLAPMSITLLMP